MTAHLLLLVALAASDLDARLGALRSPSAAERDRAQRWICARATPADAGALELAWRDGDAEVRARIVEAIGGSDALLGVAVRLATAADDSRRGSGRAALEIALARFDPAATQAAGAPDEIDDALEKRPGETVTVDAPLAGASLEEFVELLVRADPSLPPIAIDAAFDGSRRIGAPDVDRGGDAIDVARAVVRAHGGELEPHGFGRREGPARRWIAVRIAGAARATGRELVLAWIDAVAREDEPRIRSRAARALAALGWPAAIGWLEERWRGARDEAALSGLSLAAARGAVAPLFLDPAERATLVERLHARVASGDSRGATELALAIGTAGPRARDGSDASAPLAAGLETIDPAEAFLRCVALETQAPALPSALPALERLVGGERTPAPLRMQALRARWAAGASTTPFGLGSAADLVAWSLAHGALDELLALARDAPSLAAALRAPRADSSARSKRALALAAARVAIERGDVEQAARDLVALAEGGTLDLAEALRSSARALGSAKPRAALDRARASSTDATGRLAGVAVLARLASPLEDSRERERLTALDHPAAEDLVALGALAAGDLGAGARERLRALVERGGLEPRALLAGLDRAVAELRAERDDAGAAAFARVVRFAARDAPEELRAALRPGTWPAPPPVEPRRLSSLDRDPSRAGF